MRKTSMCLFEMFKRNFGRVQLISKSITVIATFLRFGTRTREQHDCRAITVMTV